MHKTRLAPSPTGALHLGNARTFLINWLLARRNEWHITLRIEDLDGPRIKKDSAQQLISDLKWLGIDWDEGPSFQSQGDKRYADAIHRLISTGLAYPCICTRKEIDLAASAPHAEDGSTIYPGTCRGRFQTIAEAARAAGRLPAIRFAVPDVAVQWKDDFAGLQKYELAKELGDFVIAKANGTPAYQLAVVVDDAAAKVTHVVRGDDLLDSTPRQILLYQSLGLADRIPRYLHLPLVVGTDGRRLAKRHGDTRLLSFRERGTSASVLLSLLAKWCGIESAQDVGSARDLIDQFSLEKLSRSRIVLNEHTMAELA